MDKNEIQGPKPLGPGEGLKAPVPPTREPDPLDPSMLRDKELSVQQLLGFYEDMIRRDVNPAANEPHYRSLLTSLVRAELEYRDLNAMAERRYDESVKVRDLIEGLKLDNVEKIKAYGEASREADAALQTWKTAYSLYKRIHDALNPGQKMATATKKPKGS